MSGFNSNSTSTAPEKLPVISGEYIRPEWLIDEPPAYEFCIDPLVPIGAVTVINAHGGTGKSLLALKASIHIALGLPILGANTNGGKVAYMSLEDPEPVFRTRLYSIANNMQDEVSPRMDELLQKLMFINRYGLATFMATANAGKIVETKIPNDLISLLKNNDIKCLIVDTFVRTNSLNENDNSQMGLLLSLFEKIAKEAECAVILIHHQPKGAGNAGYAARGASAITDNARSVLLLEKVSSKDVGKFADENIKTAVTENRLVRVTHTKHNYSAGHPEQYFEITADGVPIELFPLINTGDDKSQRYFELHTWWNKECGGKPLTKTNIDSNVIAIRPSKATYGKNRYREALDWVIKKDFAKKVPAPEGGSKNSNAEYYTLLSNGSN